MYIAPLLSSCFLSGIVAALLATAVFGSPFGFVSAATLADPAFSPTATATNVDRSLKSDPLPVTRVDSAKNTAALLTNTTIIHKNAGTPEHSLRGASSTPTPLRILEIDGGKRAPRLVPAPLLGCEALASPVSDPILSRFSGRCLA